MSDKAALYRELLPLLEGATRPDREGRVWSYCPAHGDGEKHGRRGSGLAGRSLSLHPLMGLTCFAGCAFEQIVDALYARAGKPNPASMPGGLAARDGGRNERRESSRHGSGGDSPRDLGQARQQRRAQQGGMPESAQLVEEYEYRDPFTGTVLAYKGRFEWPAPDSPKGYEKSFRWRLPGGDWRSGIKERFPLGVVEMPLWGAETVLANPGRRVWFAEGERATAAIRARNELAVCGGWGASQGDFGEALEVLRGREVILWSDNDVPGREYMARVRAALKGIAARVVTVQAPVPPKGDAVEYFAQGGTIDELLAQAIVKPTIDILAHDHYVVRVPTDEGPVAFEFAEMTRTTGALDCELTVSHLSPAAEPEPYTQRINLLSQSAREGLQRALSAQFGKGVNWTTSISAAWSRVRTAFLETDRAIPVSELPEMEGPAWLIEGMLPLNHATVIFGEGGSGKTQIAYSFGLAVALGGEWLGMRVRQGGVVIVDYETDESEARFVLKRLYTGLGLDPLTLDYLPLWYWPAGGVPLADQADGLARFCRKHDVQLVIVDSGADACGGEPEKSGPALAYFNGLSRLGCTTLTICHVNRSDADTSSKRPYGSVFWENRPRRTIFVKRESMEDSDAIDVALIVRKLNRGRRPAAMALRLDYVGEEGPVHIRTQDIRDNPAFEREWSVADRIEQYLIDVGSGTVKDIVDSIALDAAVVRTTLFRGKGSRFTQVDGGGRGRGRSAEWAVLAK